MCREEEFYGRIKTFFSGRGWRRCRRGCSGDCSDHWTCGDLSDQDQEDRKRYFYNDHNEGQKGKVREEEKGSSTIFFALTLLLVAALIFTMLEGVHITGQQAMASLDSKSVTESLLAEYNVPLMERYHLFLLDGGDGSGQFSFTSLAQSAKERMEENLTEKAVISKRIYDMFPTKLTAGEITGYQLVTDQQGEVFYRLVTDYMKHNLTREAADRIYQKMKDASDAKSQAGDLDTKRKNAMTKLKEASEETDQKAENAGGMGKAKEATKKTDTVEDTKRQKETENPITYVKDWKNTGILKLIEADTSAMSDAKLDLSETLGKRDKNQGTQCIQMTDDWYGRILFQEYLMKYFSSYVNAKEEVCLRYELEYLIEGKATDKENLSGIATKLLAIREAANFVYLQTDTAKKSEAFTLATLIAGVSANPLLVKALQEGILAAWAFAESVSDVRTIFAGKRIPLIKTAKDWSMDVKGLAADQKFEEAKEDARGLSYEDYLRILLYLGSRNQQCMRAMDLIEQNLRQFTQEKQLRMDHMLTGLSAAYQFQAEPMFLSFVTVGNLKASTYRWSEQASVSYFSGSDE